MLYEDTAVIRFIVGTAIRDRRRKAGMTVTELAERAGIGGPHLYGIEAGERSPTIVVVVKLAQAINKTASALLRSLN